MELEEEKKIKRSGVAVNFMSLSAIII